MSTGCYLFRSDMVEPEFPVVGKKLVVIPFASEHADYFNSIAGQQLAADIARLINRQEGPDVVDHTPKLKEYFFNLELDEPDMRKVAELAGADYVLIGKITKFQPRIPGEIGLNRGRAEVVLKLVDVTGGNRLLFDKRPVKVKYPGKWDSMVGPDITEKDITDGLIKQLIYHISRLFYPYPEE